MLQARCSVPGLRDVHLDLGHVGVFRALVRARRRCRASWRAELFQAVQAQGRAGAARADAAACDASHARRAAAAARAVWRRRGAGHARAAACRTIPEIRAALDELQTIAASSVAGRRPQVGFDLAELRGYHYHSGVVFAAYAPGSANAIALGGRYDEVGQGLRARASGHRLQHGPARARGVVAPTPAPCRGASSRRMPEDARSAG